jgi:hypothetical protein
LEQVLVSRADRITQGQVLARLESRAEMAATELARFKSEQVGPTQLAQSKIEFSRRKFDRRQVMGLCTPSDEAGFTLVIARLAQSYMRVEENQKIPMPPDENVQIVKPPEHGQLTWLKNDLYHYVPDKGYLGNDRFEALVLMEDGKTVRIVHNIVVQSEPLDNPGFEIEEFCPTPYWKISFTDLPNSAVAQTTGTKITLDTNAAGYGWFIDYTPYLNEEWLPTSNPYEWQAKPGSEAEGKMDMLSVLLHEYGHTLGLEHSADAHDFMATTLQPGVRRLPSAEEWAQIASLVPELISLEWLGLSASSPSSSTPNEPNVPTPLPVSVGLAAFLASRQRHNDNGQAASQTPSRHPRRATEPRCPCATHRQSSQGRSHADHHRCD